MTLDIRAEETRAERDVRFERDIAPLIKSLYGHAMKETRNPDDAEDLLQETLLQAYTDFHQFEAGTNLNAWTHRIMRNTHIGNIRKATAKRRPQINYGELEDWRFVRADLHNDAVLRSAEDVALDAHVDKIVMEALNGLSSNQRTAVLLFDVWGYSEKEITAITGASLSTVKGRLQGGRRLLRESLRDYAPINIRSTK